MQEKVNFTPPEIQSLEGHIPPTSWYKENILHYYQIKSQIEFLTGLIIYLQQRDLENLRKTKQEGKQVLEFAYLPEGEGSAEEIANASSYNLLQNHVGTQIQYLAKLINILKMGNPQLAKELDAGLNQLNRMTQSFPQLSQEELASLSNLLARYSELSKQMPPSTQKAFWEALNEMLEKMLNANTLMKEQFAALVNSIQNKMQEMGKFKDQISSLLSLLTSGQMKEGLSQLIATLKNYPFFSPDQKKSLSVILGKAAKMTGKKGHSLLQLMSQMQLAEWIRAAGPGATKQQIVDHVQRQLKEPPFNSLSPPFMADLAAQIHRDSEEKGFLENPLPPENFLFDETSVSKGSAAIAAHFEQQHQTYENQLVGYGQAAARAGEVGENLGRSAAYGASNSIGSGSLPNDFQNAILNHYMPGQEKYLMELAMLLNFDNMGAEVGNALLSIMSNFAAAATDFDISGTLQGTGTPGQYSESPTYEKNAISKAKNNAYQALKNIQRSIDKINSEIIQIENNPNFTAAQKKEMVDKLTSIRTQLQAAQGQLQALYNLYSHLKVGQAKNPKPPPSYLAKACTVTYTGPIPDDPTWKWQDALSAYENIATNGATAAEAKKWGVQEGGGLVPISSQVNTFQQKYADQGQNQQMLLQMRMTEIQQEWTVVSTALQSLNQMYMSLAQGIYK